MDDWRKKYHQFKRVTQPLTELELLVKNAFEDYYPDIKLELIRIQEPLFFEENDHIFIAFVCTLEEHIDYKTAHNFFLIIQSKLSEINEERFPAISYIDYDDYMENTPKDLLA